MAVVLWTLGSIPFLAWSGWASWRYYTLTRKKLGLDEVTHPLEVFTGLWGRLWPYYTSQQADTHMESLRRRVWWSIALFVVYALLGASVWVAVVRALSL